MPNRITAAPTSRKRATLATAALASLAMSFALPAAQAQTIDCANPVGMPGQLPPEFNIWGPSAVCAAATAGASMSSLIGIANTAFLTQTGPFVGSPTDRMANSTGGGFWIRGIGGRVDFTPNVNVTATGIGGVFGGASAIVGMQSDFGGFQAGGDLGRFNLGDSGWNLHVGITGGYLYSNNRDSSGQATSEFDIPFVGGYLALVHASGFFADLTLRGTWYDMRTTNPFVGVANQSFSARGVSLTGSAGYRVPLQGAWFIEPSIGAVWSHVSVDSLTMPGGGPFNVPAGVTTFDDVNSFLGRAGARLGTSFVAGSVAIQPYVVASVWHEFQGASNSQFVCNGCPFGINVETGTVGTYGQFGVGAAASFGDTGWLSYLRFDYRTGRQIDGWSLNAGLRYQWDQGPAPVVARY